MSEIAATEVKKKSAKKLAKKRDWKTEALPFVFTVRATEDEGFQLRELAARTGWSMSRLVIVSTLQNGVRSASEVQAAEAERRENLEQIIFETRKIEINIRQISHALNAAYRGEGEPPEQTEIESTLKEINSFLKAAKTKL